MRFIKLKQRSEFTKNVFTLITGTVIAQIIPLAISPVLTRLYTPEDFGVFALFVALVGLLSTTMSFRYEQAVILPKYDKYAINILILSLLIIGTVFLFSEFIIFLFYDKLLSLIDNSIMNWLYVIPITAMFIAIFNLLVNFNNRLKNYKCIANSIVIKSLTLSFVQILMGFIKGGALGLIVGQIFSQLFANISLLKNITKNKKLISSISYLKIIAVSKKYIKFPKFNMPHAFLSSISESLPIYILTFAFSSKIVGFYSLAIMIVLTPLMIIASSISRVYNQKITEFDTRKDLQSFTKTIIKSLLLRISIPFVLFVLFVPEIFGFVFGEEWRVSATFIQILSPWLLLVFVVGVLSFLPNFFAEQKKAMYIEMVYFLIKMISLVIGSLYDDIYLALILYSISSSLVLIYTLVWYFKLLNKVK